MPLDPLSAGISGASAIISSVINAASQSEANKQNAQLAEKSNQWSIDQWNRENAYNLPSQQRARLEAAGLNPAMMYGNGGISNEAAQSPAVSSPPAMQPIMRIDPLTASQIALNNAQAKKLGTDVEVSKHNIEADNVRLTYEGALNDAQVDNLRSHTKLLSKQLDEVSSNIAVNNATIAKYDSEIQSRYLHDFLEYESTRAQIAKIQKDMEWTDLQAKYYAAEVAARIGDLKASAELKKIQSQLTEKQIDQVKQEVDNLKLVGEKLDFDLKSDRKYKSAERSMALASQGASILTSFYSNMTDIQKLIYDDDYGRNFMYHSKRFGHSYF